MPTPKPFKRVNRESTAGLITRQLREGIMYGSLAPGSQLSEAVLAEQFGVSRGPLREAMQRLVQEGLVRAEPNRGLFVKELDEAGIRDLYVARIALETAAGRLIIEAADDDALARLREAFVRMRTAADIQDLEALSDADLDFHTALVACSGSPRLARMHETLMVETRMCLTALQKTYQAPEEQIAEHRRITDAIAAGDAEELVSAVEAHLQVALRRLVGLYTPEPASA